MISITGQNTGNDRDPKPFENACHRRFTSPKLREKLSQINGHATVQKRQLSVNEWCKKVETHAAILFPANALHSQGVRGKQVSLRTIAQDLTSFSKHSDHSGY